ncbi:hypothetical protein ACH5RR_016136 [Cinchona calisaya]|uniref:Uncharacterized protein n=1 Tax=Cinchona calisaya TaxID=153742 RepID=A0ABD2ZV40_9GENT
MFSFSKKADKEEKGKKPADDGDDDRWSKLAQQSYNNNNNNNKNKRSNEWNQSSRYTYPGMSEDSHYAQQPKIVEAQKNRQVWSGRRHVHWNYKPEKMEQNWRWPTNHMELEDIHNHLLHGDGEEVVWQDDVWGLQQYTQIPPNLPADKAKDKRK